MAKKDVLIRKLDEEDVAWLDENKPPGISQRDFLKSLIASYRLGQSFEQESLFQPAKPDLAVLDSVPFRFVDLFAGIGGFRCALTAVGGTCVYSSEWDKFAAATYETWYGERPDMRDIREVDFAQIPDHDVLTAGFPTRSWTRHQRRC